MSDATSVYQYYDSRDVLLYVGITSRGKTRNIEHYRSKEWWPYVARQDVAHYTTRAEAEAVEQQIIRACRPPFNKQHNPNHGVLSRAYMDFAPPPKTSRALVRVCSVCQEMITDQQQAAAILSVREFVAARRYNGASEKNEIAWHTSAFIERYEESLKVVAESETVELAELALADLILGDASCSKGFLNLPIRDLVRRRRDELGQRPTDHTDLREAQWHLAHRPCVPTGSMEMTIPPHPSATWASWATASLHNEGWAQHSDWQDFLERYLGVGS